MQSRRLLPLIGALLMGVLVACGTTAEPTVTPRPADGSTEQREPWQIEEQELVAAAQQEGQLILVMGGGESRAHRSVWEEFQRIYGIEVVITAGSGAELSSRMLAERAGGRYEVDIFLTGGQGLQNMAAQNALDPIPPLLYRPDVLDETLWLNGRHLYADEVAGEQTIFVWGSHFSPTPIPATYNTERVSQADLDAINSVWDFLDPKWKGQIVAIDADGPGVNTTYWNIYLHPDIGPDWILRFWNDMDVTFMTDTRVMADSLAQGRFAWGILPGTGVRAEAVELKRLGFPVEEFVKPLSEPAFMENISSIGVLNRAPNPNAAKLALNWWLSYEGQTAMHQLSVGDSRATLREDVTVFDAIPAHNIREAGIDYQYPHGPEHTEARREAEEWHLRNWAEALAR